MAIRNNTRGPLFELMSSNAESLEQRQMGINGCRKKNLKIYRQDTSVLAVEAMKLRLELPVEDIMAV